MIRIAYASDLHCEFDRGLVEDAQRMASRRGAPGAATLSWWQHLRDRDAEHPNHPLLGPDLFAAQGADLLVLAGDVDIGVKAVEYADHAAAFLGWPTGTDKPTFVSIEQWLQINPRTLDDPYRGLIATVINADGSQQVYLGREGVRRYIKDHGWRFFGGDE